MLLVCLMLSRRCANAHWRQSAPYLEELVLADKPAVGLTMQMQGVDMIRKSMDNEIVHQREAASLPFHLEYCLQVGYTHLHDAGRPRASKRADPITLSFGK